MIQVSAPAKVHLIGEHAIVYGEPAILTAVGKRIYVSAERSNKVILEDARFKSRHEWSRDEAIQTANQAEQMWKDCAAKGNFTDLLVWAKDGGLYKTYWKALLGISLKMSGADFGIHINITKCEIPTGSGLGSSSSAAVAIAKAVSKVYNKNLSLERINEIALECEKLIHGNPSGGDNSTCCFGGLVWFQKAQPKPIIRSLKEEIPHQLENFVLVYTGPPKKTTGELVQMVRDLPEKFRTERVKSLGIATQAMRDALRLKDYKKMKDLINYAQKNLAELGVSTHEIDIIAKTVKNMKGAAKLCGAGGGGMMLCWHEDKEKLVKTIKYLGYTPIEAELGVEGVRIEN